MAVPMMKVRIVRMLVYEGRVPVPVRMRLTNRITRIVNVLVMSVVMHMPVFMLQRLVRMFVLVPFRQMQIDTEQHEHGCDVELQSKWLGKQEHGQRSADEGRGREVRACPRGSEVAQREHKEDEADAVAKKPKRTTGNGLARGWRQ